MKRVIQQRSFFLRDGLQIFDEEGEVCFSADAEAATFRSEWRLRDPEGREKALITRRFSPLRPVFTAAAGEASLRIVKKATLFRQIYEIRPLGWLAEGDPSSREYFLRRGEQEIARIAPGGPGRNRRTEVLIEDEKNELPVLCTALVIRSVLDRAASMKA